MFMQSQTAAGWWLRLQKKTGEGCCHQCLNEMTARNASEVKEYGQEGVSICQKKRKKGKQLQTGKMVLILSRNYKKKSMILCLMLL